MSFKLQDKIQATPGIPGKHKRLLVAMAKRSRNDGTNIFASKEDLGALAGVSERTAFRVIGELVEAGAVLKAETHKCDSKFCSKGTQHQPVPGGAWTQAYNINIEGLEEAAEKLRTFSEHRTESRKPKVEQVVKTSYCQSEWHDILTLQPYSMQGGIVSVWQGDILSLSSMPFWQAKQGPSNPAPLGSNSESSVLTYGDSKQESQSPSLATLTTAPPAVTSLREEEQKQNQPLLGLERKSEEANQDQKQNQPQNHSEVEAEFYAEDVFTPEEYLLGAIMPKPSAAAIAKGLPVCRQILTYFSDQDEYAGIAAEAVLRFNRAHRGHKYATKDDKAMYIRTPQQYLKALESEKATLLTDHLTHDFENCELCGQAGIIDYRKLCRSLRKDKQEREEKKRAAAKEAARVKAEQERIAKAEAERIANPPKFDVRMGDQAEGKSLAKWFRENSKVGEWEWSAKEREAFGANYQHMAGVIRYLRSRDEKATKEQFVALIQECVAENPDPQATYVTAGDTL